MEPILGGADKQQVMKMMMMMKTIGGGGVFKLKRRKTMRKSQTHPVVSPWQQSDCVWCQPQSGGRGEAEDGGAEPNTSESYRTSPSHLTDGTRK